MDSSLLVRARSLITEAESALTKHGLDSRVELSPRDRNPRSISWIVEGAYRMSQIVLWEDGQSEVELAEVETGQIVSDHRQIDGEGALIELVGSTTSWLLEAGMAV